MSVKQLDRLYMDFGCRKVTKLLKMQKKEKRKSYYAKNV